MRQSTSRILVVSATLLVLGVVNESIVDKERLRTRGERILLELAPVDPRSLMQGDYMALRFRLAEEIPADTAGRVALQVDANGVATRDPEPGKGALRLRYRIRNGQVWLGTNAYFFEEGGAGRYAGARYGEFRVNRHTGEGMLVGLAGPDREPL